MQQMPLIQSLYQIGAIKFGEFTLKSGQSSKIYLDIRQIISHPNILQAVSDAIWAKAGRRQYDLVCGVPYTALPIATCISLFNSIPMIMRRKEKKEYGTKQQIEGSFQPGQNCLIIEDVITTGSSIIETAHELESSGLVVTDLAVLIDREQGGKENLQNTGYHVHAVFTLQEIMRDLIKTNCLTPNERIIVNGLLCE